MRSRCHFLVSQPRCDGRCDRNDDACSFRVAWSINPHMKIGAVRTEVALQEHAVFVRALEAEGATVTSLPFVHGAFDSVFSKDNAMLLERQDGTVEALLARPKYPERRVEQAARAHELRRAGIVVGGTAPFEGGDLVMLPDAHGCFLGHGFRSDPAAAKDIAAFLDRDVVCIELRDPRLYHLDMALAVLEDGTALVCAEALTERSRRALEAHPAIREIVRVPLDEALRFGINLVQVGRSVVLAGDSATTARAVHARGYRLRRVTLEQFHHAGGSAACLVSRVHQQRSRARAAA